MSGECKCQHIKFFSNYPVSDQVARIRRIAAFLGISNVEISSCNISLGELISIAQRRASKHPNLWAYLKATYANANFSHVLSRLESSGNSSQAYKIIEMANNGYSAITAQNYVDELLKKASPPNILPTLSHFKVLA